MTPRVLSPQAGLQCLRAESPKPRVGAGAGL